MCIRDRLWVPWRSWSSFLYRGACRSRNQVATRHPKMHGKVEGATCRCAIPGCDAHGEYKAPVQPADFDGPGVYRLLCLEHVREHNAKYNYFEGMSADEIAEAQSP